ncbi:hypothetical protein [Brasilonema sp. UFV-L1]|uniref:hypothetical protein n=1 Tax=Brasilonema sp. UFV-L1 TaxID=2234130 RepID=UPI00403F7434
MEKTLFSPTPLCFLRDLPTITQTLMAMLLEGTAQPKKALTEKMLNVTDCKV